MRKAYLFTVLALFLTLSAAEAAVRKITVVRVGAQVSRIVVPVRACAQGLRQVRLDVAVSSIFVEKMGARFADGREIALPLNKSFPVGNGQWTDIAPVKGMGCVAQVFAIARSETRAPARVTAFGDFE